MTTKAPTRRNDALLNDLLNDAADDYERETKAPTKTKAPAGKSGRQEKPEIGFLNPDAIILAFRMLMYAGIVLLAFLSVAGTFYGRAGQQAPLDRPGQVVADITAAPNAFGLALGIQVVLTLLQYGSRQMARHNPRWWLLYLVSLGVSLWYNIHAYYEPILAMHVPWLLDYIIIAAADVVPEFASVRKRRT